MLNYLKRNGVLMEYVKPNIYVGYKNSPRHLLKFQSSTEQARTV